MEKLERQQIRSLIEDDRFRAVEKLFKIVIAEISSFQVKADDQFNTIWRTAKREGGVEVLEDFYKRMIKEASDDN